MSIKINQEKCKGCKACLYCCPGSLLKLNEAGKAYIKYPKDCWGCSSCIKECKFQAIDFYLGADIGGMGSKMNVKEEGDFIHWNIKKSSDMQSISGQTETITINKKDANKY